MPDFWMDVDTALPEVPVNLMPLIDDTDFKTRETAVAFNAAGMDLVWNFVTTGGAMTQTSVTPTSGGVYDWSNQGDGMYAIEIPASGGVSINNDTEGFGWFTGMATGILPWRGPVIGFRAAGLNDKLIDSAYSETRGLAGTALHDAIPGAGLGLPTFLNLIGTINPYGTVYFVKTTGIAGNDGLTPATPKNLTGALAAAVSGDLIFLYDGTYTGQFTMPVGVTIRGQSWKAIIDRGAFPAAGAALFMDSDCVIENCTVQGQTTVTAWQAAIKSVGGKDVDRILIRNCRLYNAGDGFWANTNHRTTGRIERCFIDRCGNGIDSESTGAESWLIVSDCFIRGLRLGLHTSGSGSIYAINTHVIADTGLTGGWAAADVSSSSSAELVLIGGSYRTMHATEPDLENLSINGGSIKVHGAKYRLNRTAGTITTIDGTVDRIDVASSTLATAVNLAIAIEAAEGAETEATAAAEAAELAAERLSAIIAGAVPVNVGGGISETGLWTIIRGDTLTAVLTLPEGSLSDADEAWVTIKRTRDDVDSQCVIQWKKSTGLVFVQGTPAGGSFTGSFTQDTDEQITVTASAAATALITPRGNLVYDVQKRTAGGTVTTIVEGTARILPDITRTTS